MAQRLLDTCILINHWKYRWGHSVGDRNEAEASQLAQELMKLHATDAIVTPVRLMRDDMLGEFREMAEGGTPSIALSPRSLSD